MFFMSYNEAMIVQRSQMIFYRNLIGRPGIKAIKSETKSCPKDLNPDDQIKVSEINELVPRGGSFERYINRHGQYVCKDRSSWHDAIRKGFF